MRRENRPQFPPGSIPGPNTSRPRPPPGLPNPNLPVTAQQQQAALVAHRQRSNSIAYDAVIAALLLRQRAHFQLPLLHLPRAASFVLPLILTVLLVEVSSLSGISFQ